MTTKLMIAIAAAMVVSTGAWAADTAANIPFSFSVGKTVLPAGKYVIDTNAAPHVMRVRSQDWRHAVMILTINKQPAKPTSEGKLVFSCYGNDCFLSYVIYAGGSGQQLAPTAREKELLARVKRQQKTLFAGN